MKLEINRIKASLIHLALSLSIAALIAWVIFLLWFPYPYREISGGAELFFIIIAVDVTIGPLITWVIFNPKKPKPVLRRDLAVVGCIQLIALCYGLWTLSLARPVHLVFEMDRFRVVHAVEIPPELLPQTPAGIVALPWTGPTLTALRHFQNNKEEFDATLVALQGISLSARPDLWRTYAEARSDILAAGHPITELEKRFPSQALLIAQTIQDAGRTADQVLYLPLVSRRAFWTVLIDAKTADVIAYLPLDSF